MNPALHPRALVGYAGAVAAIAALGVLALKQMALKPIHVLCSRLGDVFSAQQRWHEAAEWYRQAIAHQPDYVSAYSNLAVALQYQGHHEEAIEVYQTAINLAPNEASLHNNLGRSLAHLHQFDAAIAAYQHAIALKPDFMLAHHNLGRLWQRQGYHHEAIGSFQVVLNRQPQAVYGDIGNSWLTLGETQRALVYFRQAILPQRALIDAYCQLYQTPSTPSDDPLGLARRASIQFLQSLLAADPAASTHLANVYLHWGDLLMQDGGRSQHRQAEQLYTRALQVNPQLTVSYERLIHCLQAQQRLAAAVFVQQYANGLSQASTESLPLNLNNLSSNPASLPKVDTALPPCAGLNCTSCLHAIAQSYRPVQVGVNLYKLTAAGWDAEPPVQDILTLPQGRCWAAPHEAIWKICNGIAVFDQKGRWIDSRSREYPGQLPNCTKPPHHERDRLADQYPIQALPGRVAVISGLSGHIYFHWMVDILPRLELLHQAGIDLSSLDAIVVNSQQLPFQKETLRLFGVPEDRVVESDRYPHIQAEELIVPAFPGPLGWATPNTLKALRDRILPHISLREDYPERLYISRADAAYRQVLNEAALVTRLADEGFVSVCLTGQSVVEQAALFHHAKIIIAPHGSSLTNLVFCRPGTVVVELTSPYYVRPYYWGISRQLGLHHLVVYAEVLGCDAIRQVMSPNPLTEDLWIADSTIDALLAHLATLLSNLSAPAAVASSHLVQESSMLPYLKDAIATCEKAFQTQAGTFQASRTLGHVLQAQGLFDEALMWHTLAVHPSPDLAAVHSGLGQLYAHQQQWEAAIAAYQNALAENDTYAQAHWGLAEIYAKLGDTEAEAQHRALAITLQPQRETAERQFLLGNAYLAQQSTSDAIAAYQAAIEYRPDFLEAHYNLGTALLQAQRYKEAIAAYQAALRLDATHAASHYGLGSALDALGDTDSAIMCYQQATVHNPDFFEAYQQLGNAFKKQKRWSEAADAFQRVIELKPEFPWAHHSLGVMYLWMNQPQQAIVHLEHAAQKKPDTAQFHQTLGNALARVGRMDDAIAAYKRSLALPSDAPTDLPNLAQMLRKHGYSDAALVCYQQAIEDDPTHPIAYIGLQYIPIKDYQVSRFITFYRQIQASGRAFHPLLWSNLGDMFTRNKQLVEAIDSYREGCYTSAIKSYPRLAQVEWPLQKTQAPHFIIIGATKCGTTSLHQYLRSHAQILMPQRKELDFFLDELFPQGKEWYLAHFPSITDQAGYYTGEASPNYFDSVKATQRIYDLFPTVKLIALLRNPVDRALSAYYHLVRDGMETRSLKTAIAHEITELSALTEDQLMQRSCGYQSAVFGGLYVYKLKRWLTVFPREQLLILKSEDFFKNTAEAMQQVYDFLELHSTSASNYGKHNVGSYSNSENSDEIRHMLSDFFRPHTHQLEEYLGMEFGWNL